MTDNPIAEAKKKARGHLEEILALDLPGQADDAYKLGKAFRDTAKAIETLVEELRATLKRSGYDPRAETSDIFDLGKQAISKVLAVDANDCGTREKGMLANLLRNLGIGIKAIRQDEETDHNALIAVFRRGPRLAS